MISGTYECPTFKTSRADTTYKPYKETVFRKILLLSLLLNFKFQIKKLPRAVTNNSTVICEILHHKFCDTSSHEETAS